MAILLAAIAVLAVAGLVVLISGGRISPQGPHDANSEASSRAVVANHTVLSDQPTTHASSAEPLVSLLEKHEKSIAAASTIIVALFTIVLAIATGFLWLATRDLVREAEHTSKRQLRAYVGPDVASIERGETGLLIRISVKNFGTTRALGVNAVTYHHLIEGSPDAIMKDDWQGATVTRGHVFGILEPQHARDIQIALSDISLSEITEPELGFHIKTIVTYQDAFEANHVRTFTLYANHAVPIIAGVIRLDISPNANDERQAP